MANLESIERLIIAKKEEKTTTARGMLSRLAGEITPVNLIHTMTKDFGDSLTKYSNKEGNIENAKIPQSLWIVAIVHEINKCAQNNKWALGRQYDFIYIYNGKLWLQVDKQILEGFMSEASLNLGVEFRTEARTARFKENALKQFLSDSTIFANMNNNENILINFDSGTLEIKNGRHTLREHRKEDYLTNIMPFEYDPKVTAHIFEKYLDEVLPDQESQDLLQEFCGFIFTKHLKIEKTLVLYGSGANGKSVFFEVITSLIGRNNYSTYSMGDLTDSDSGNANRAGLKDKILNYGSELRGDKMDSDIFKKLTSGEPVTARLKYGNPFDLEGKTKFMFNANKLPQNVEQTDAFFRRFLIIPFDQTIPEEDRDYELHTKIIKGELSGVFNWVLEGLDRLISQGRFSESTKAQVALETYRLESDSVSMFCQEVGYAPSRIDTKRGTAMFDEYKRFCIDANFRHVSTKNFYERLRGLGYKTERLTDNKMFVYAA